MNGEGHIVHLSITCYFRFSSVPKQASPLNTASPFRVCIWGAVDLPTVVLLKDNTNLHPAFASFYITSAFWLKIRISIHFEPPNFLWETAHLF